MILVAVKDQKADVYLRPNFQSNLADALRSWETVANEGESMITKFPNDFRLHHLGDFDAASGVLTVLDSPRDLGSASDFSRKNPPSL